MTTDIRCAYCRKKIAEVLNGKNILVCPSTDLNIENIFEKTMFLHLCRKCKKKTIICEK